MKKFFTLIAAAFVAVSVNAARTTLWEDANGVTVAWGSSNASQQDASVGSSLAIGDVLIITVKGVDSSVQYPQLGFKGADWANVGSTVGLWSVSAFPYEAKITLTEAMVDGMANGFWITGDGATVTKLELEKSTSTVDMTNAIWIGENVYPDTNWWTVDAVSVGKSLFATAKAGDKLEFRASAASTAFLVQPFFGGWDGTAKNSNDLPAQFSRVDNTITYTLTAEDVTSLKSDGLVVQAGGCTLNVIALVPVTTAIDAIGVIDDASAPIYNLSGQRVGSDYKGIVIQNGQKRIQK